MDRTFQFSSGCLAESLDGTAREEKFDRINYSWKNVWTGKLRKAKIKNKKGNEPFITTLLCFIITAVVGFTGYRLYPIK